MISSERLRDEYRKSPKDFTRQRVLPFAAVLVLMLSGHKVSLQNALNKFFKALGRVFETPSGSAYCQARQKVKAEVYAALNESVRDDFHQLYEGAGEVAKWRGHRLLGSDGSYLNLPDTPDLRAAFSVHRNQHKGEKHGTVQALGMVLYDLLNDLGVKGAIGPSHSSEKGLLLNQLWSELKVGDVLVLDRNSADYAILAKAVKDAIGIVIRCRRNSFTVVREFIASPERERIVKLALPASRQTVKYVKEHELPVEIEVRLLKFKLASGEEEILLTTLCDGRKYPRKEFFQVYGWRWRDETYYDRIKNIFEVERFSGLSDRAVSNRIFTGSSFWRV